MDARIALVCRSYGEYDDSIFPDDYYRIPGVRCYQDVDAARRYAYERMLTYRGQTVELYVNGGMAVELLLALQAAVKLSIKVIVCHRDNSTHEFCRQQLIWKPVDPDDCGAGKEEGPSLSLCGERHFGMSDTAIFKNVPSECVLDFAWQEKCAREALTPYSHKKVSIAVTGLKPLLISVLNVACDLDIQITWLHYDSDREEYFAQPMDKIIL
ncbi:MAG: hypothetical protein LUI87_02680 [Lachnospiraceae bacterium]|nr:hypothetical protein [Lachnospiraceae bacterium]